MILLTYPWALLALISLPLLTAFYFLMGKSKPKVVSSLFLWETQKPSPTGGIRLEKLQMPLLFFLELLVLGLLALAATMPKLNNNIVATPLVVVLDNSFSMLAGGDRSPRSLAWESLDEALVSGRFSPIRWVLAEEKPRLLTLSQNPASLSDLASWNGSATSADLGQAVALASQLAGSWGKVWVLSDHPPPFEIESGIIKWQSFGQARPNLAFVNAARGGERGRQWCMVEIANWSDQSQSAVLRVADVSLRTSGISLKAGEIRRLVFNVADGSESVRLTLPDDSLTVDNSVILVAALPKPVPVALEISDEALAASVGRAILATDRAVISAVNPHLIIYDGPAKPGASSGEAWRVRFLSGEPGTTFLGPFVADREHPLLEGLAFTGVRWHAFAQMDVAGTPLLLAGEDPLVTAGFQEGRREIIFNFRLDGSNLQAGPNWPALFWNLIAWRASESTGLEYSNLKLGSTAVFRPEPRGGPVTVEKPDGTSTSFPTDGRVLQITGNQKGLFRVHQGARTDLFAVNALQGRESDLSGATSGTWGSWLESSQTVRSYQNLLWLLLLVAMVLATLHGWLVQRRTDGLKP